MPNIHKHSLVLVEWLDSTSPSRKWQDLHAIKDFEITSCFTVGWLGRKDSKATVLYSSYHTDEIGDMTAIPSHCVKKITVLKK